MSSKTNRKYNTFAFWFVFSFVLNGYASGVPGVSLGSLSFFLIIVFSLFSGSKIKQNANIYIVVTLLLLLSVLGYISVGLYANPLISILKLVVWALMINQVCPSLFRSGEVTKWMTRFSIAAVIYLALQLVVKYILGGYLPNIFNIGILKPYEMDYADYERLSESFIYRPASFFSESSFCGNFLLAALLLNLESSKHIVDRIKVLVFLSAGIIMSSSTSAIILLFIAWFVYFKKLRGSTKMISVLIIAAVIFWIFLNPINISEGSNLAYSLDKLNNLDSSARLGRSFGYLALVDPNVLFIGVGIGNDLEYLKSLVHMDVLYINSLTSLVVAVGVIGTLIMFVFVLWLLFKSVSKRSRIAVCLVIFYIIKAFSSGMMFSPYGILYLMMVYAYSVYDEQCVENNNNDVILKA